jgi:putative endonuclease
VSIGFAIDEEEFREVHTAIARETQIKGWLRWKKKDLIEASNPHWEDLSERW